MRIRESYPLAAELVPWYRRARRRERGEILDGFCLATGYHRRYAMPLLRGRRRRLPPRQRIPPKRRMPRARRCGLEFRRALKVCWEATDYLCAERLQPFLPDLLLLLLLLLLLVRLGQLERTLHDLRRGLVARRISQTKPGAGCCGANCRWWWASGGSWLSLATWRSTWSPTAGSRRR